MKLFVYDLETTGLDPSKHAIHQLSGLIIIDGVVMDKFNYKIRPHEGAELNKVALSIGRVTPEILQTYPSPRPVFKEIKILLSRYVDRFDRRDKFFLVGYNNARFDDIHFRAFFERLGDSFFGAWFYSSSLDVMVLAAEYLGDRQKNMKSFKLQTVAKELGIKVDENKLHDAEYDIYLAYQVYKIVTGKDLEI